MGRRATTWLLLCAVFLLAPCGIAAAQGASEDQYGGSTTGSSATGSSATGAGQTGTSGLRDRLAEQDAALQDKVDRVSAVGRDLQQTQSRLAGSQTRAGQLQQQTKDLEQQISAQKNALRRTKADYEDKARAAYKGQDLQGLTGLLDGWLGSGRITGSMGQGVADVLLQGKQELQAYQDSRQTLQDTLRQISQKKSDYENAVKQQQSRTAELRRQEDTLNRSIAGLTADRQQTASRLQQLTAAQKARIQDSQAATGGGDAGKGYQLGIARNDIVARPVASMPKKEYMKLYKKAAKEYGFGPDWYVLAAVGRVESNDGENMGPSSAGAMGPMQFLPSTWKATGVDGNGDGVANIMDPRDAIPAAAAYLKDGGAPGDWYKALYTYNHADWYVKKVLAVAEAYRRMAHDDRVGPYI